MKKEREFARRVKALYEKQGPDAGDLRSEELSTMFDLFLGKTFDKRRKVEIARVQEDLHNKQERLANEFHAGELNADQYIDSLNSMIGETFAECKRILGPKDFERLFGALYPKEKDFVDRSAFLTQQHRDVVGTRVGHRQVLHSRMECHDKVLKCAECGAEFVFTAGERMFFADKGFKNEPKRCKACKSKRAQTAGSGNFQRTETKTTCSQCGKETTVSFKSTQGRAVYCRECFQQRGTLGSAV